MTASFKNKSGVMTGLDAHRYFVGPFPLAPPPAVPIIWLHVVAAPFTWVDTNGGWCNTVTSEGWNMVKGGYCLYLVPHVPLPIACPPPSSLEVAQLIMVIAISTSKAYLSVGTVTGEGAPLACCLAEPIGVNMNCNGIGVVFNSNSVVTSPSYGDMAGAAVEHILDTLWSKALGKALPDPIAKYLFNRFVKPHVVSPLIKYMRNLVQEQVHSIKG
jgi:hypothetical protein